MENALEYSFHKRRLLCKDCHSSFYETPYWIHPSLRMTQASYDSILLNPDTASGLLRGC